MAAGATPLKQTNGRDEKPETAEMFPEGVSTDQAPKKSKRRPKAKAPSQTAEKQTPPFEKIDPKEFQTDPIAAAAAAEKNTSAFFAELENFRLDESEIMGVAVGREILTRVPVKRPGKKEFVRAHPDPRMTIAMALYVDDSDDGDGEAYIVHKDMREVFGDDVKAVLLQVAMTRSGVTFIWPLTIPQPDSGRGRSWHESAMIARDHAKKAWVKVRSDRGLSGYRVFPAEGHISEPQWLDKTIEELLEIAFRDHIIKSMDHPIVRKYLGR
jgi:hypothetical protein